MKATRIQSDNAGYLLLAIFTIIAFTASCGQSSDGTEASAEMPDLERLATPLFEEDTVHVTVPQGTRLTIRLSDPVSSEFNLVGDPVKGTVATDVYEKGEIVIPRGSRVTGIVTDATPLDDVGGFAGLSFTFDTLVTPDGNEYPISATFARSRSGSSFAADTLVILGRVLESGDGARISDRLDNRIKPRRQAGVMEGLSANTRGMEVELPAATEVRLTLRAPVIVEVVGG